MKKLTPEEIAKQSQILNRHERRRIGKILGLKIKGDQRPIINKKDK